MPKNPFYADKVVLRNGGVIETQDGTDIISVSSAGAVTINSSTETLVDLTTTGDTTLGNGGSDATQINGTLTVGVDDTGYDVKFFGATSGAYCLWDESADDLILAGAAGLSVAGLTTLGALTTDDTQAGGASNGPLIKKSLQAGEAYTGTTAGLMVKNYGDDGTETVPSGEFTGLYVNLKGLHTDPGNNTSLISAHVHTSNTTTVHAGLWLYGDMTNGVKASGSTLTTFLDGHEATAITNLADLKSGTDLAVEASAATPAGNTTHCLRILIDGTTPGYIPVYAAKTF